MFCCSFFFILNIFCTRRAWQQVQRQKNNFCWRKNSCLICDRCMFQHLNWASREGARITAYAAAFGENNELANSTWGSVSSLGNRSAWSISVACALGRFCSEWEVSKYVIYWLFCLLADTLCSIIRMTYAVRCALPFEGRQNTQAASSFSWAIP